MWEIKSSFVFLLQLYLLLLGFVWFLFPVQLIAWELCFNSDCPFWLLTLFIFIFIYLELEPETKKLFSSICIWASNFCCLELVWNIKQSWVRKKVKSWEWTKVCGVSAKSETEPVFGVGWAGKITPFCHFFWVSHIGSDMIGFSKRKIEKKSL